MQPLVLQNRGEILRKLDGDDDDEEEEEVKSATRFSEEEHKENNEVEEKPDLHDVKHRIFEEEEEQLKFVTSSLKEEDEEEIKEEGEEKENIEEEEEEKIDMFNQMPDDVKYRIFSKLDSLEILIRVQYVCSSWWKLIKDHPSLFRVIDARDLAGRLFHYCSWEPRNLWHTYSQCSCGSMDRCRSIFRYTSWKHHWIRRAIDLSCGQLVVFAICGRANDDLLHYAFDRSKSLQRFVLQSCYRRSGSELIDAVRKVPLLEEIEFLNCVFSNFKEVIAEIGSSCLNLKKFAINYADCGYRYSLYDDDEQAFAIAENMPKLTHLSLIGNNMTNEGLEAILDGCQCLEYLDIRRCEDIEVDGKLLEQCEQRLIHLTLPDHSSDDLDDYDEETNWSYSPLPDFSDDYSYYDKEASWGCPSFTEDEEDYDDEDILKFLPPKAATFYI